MPRLWSRRAGVVLTLCLGLTLAGCAEPEPDLELNVPVADGSATIPPGGVSPNQLPPDGAAGADGAVGTGPQSSGSTTGQASPNGLVLPGSSPSGSSRDPAAAPSGIPAGLTPACPASTSARTYDARSFNAVMQNLSLPQWRAADVGATARLSDGRVAWIFGDTLRPSGYRPLVGANSLLISSNDCFAQVTVPTMQPLIPVGKQGEACWPTSIAAFAINGGDRLYVACSRVQRLPGGLLEFTYLGASLAQLRVPSGGTPVVERVLALTPDNHDQKQINWGASLLREDRWLYVFGSQQPEAGTAKAVYVARTPVDAPAAAASWEFWDGGSWQRDAGRAAVVLPADHGVSQAFSVHRIGSKFVLVSKKGGEFGKTIGVWTAPTPAGPWALASETAYTYDDGSGFVTYQPLAHPEFSLVSGNLLVSMSRNPKKFTDLLVDPRQARPVFVEVPRP